jgi:hypothetical protein
MPPAAQANHDSSAAPLATRPPVLVLGMHRSGTSSLTGSLEQRGLYVGEVAASNVHNARGNRESRQVTALNQALLEHNGGSWQAPPRHLAWSAAHARLRDGICADFRTAATGQWGFKDPRMLLTLPFWLEGLGEVRLVGTFRHPALVARSLSRRNGLDPATGIGLWLHYNQRLLALHAQRPFPLVCFDSADAVYRAHVEAVATWLGLPPLPTGVPAFFDSGLRNDAGAAHGIEVPAEAASVYDRLLARADPAA